MKTKPCVSRPSPSAIAALLRVVTGVSVYVFTLDTLPHEWADYPEGYSVFSTTMNILTGEQHVAVYYKGECSSAAMTAAANALTKAGFKCQPPSRGSKKRQASIVVTATKQVA